MGFNAPGRYDVTVRRKPEPKSLHGGPGRAGGGQELGGLRALDFYHRRAAIQAAGPVLAALQGQG